MSLNHMHNKVIEFFLEMVSHLCCDNFFSVVLNCWTLSIHWQRMCFNADLLSPYEGGMQGSLSISQCFSVCLYIETFRFIYGNH